LISRRFIVEGRVQGVGFRWFVVSSARRAGLSGWVRNLPDGAVEVVAAGSEEALDLLREDLRKGPVASSVRDLSESEVGEADRPSGSREFQVKY